MRPHGAVYRIFELCRPVRSLSRQQKPQRYRPSQVRSCSCSATRLAPAPNHGQKASNIPQDPQIDHRSVAIDQQLFTTSLYSPGSPLLLPNGAHVFNKLIAFLRAQYRQFGFREVITPTIYKRTLWEKSGHWQNYKNDMFEVHGKGASGENLEAEIGEDEPYGLKPMNCPGHCLLFRSQRRSWRELPVRFADFSPLHRDEVSGSLSGLTRVRRFHQDDGHIFCRPDQILEEISRTLQFVEMVYSTFGLGKYKLLLSTRPEEQYIGTLEEWTRAEDQLKVALDRSGRDWAINEGDGAFYGPKIDIILQDADGKEHQTATVQLDFQLPKNFELTYQVPISEVSRTGTNAEEISSRTEPEPAVPVIIHRAIFGSLERFMALLIERYNGRWPFWLSPRQVIIVTVNDSEPVLEYTEKVAQELSGTKGLVKDVDGVLIPEPLDSSSFLIDTDTRPMSLSKKIQEAKAKRYNVIVVVGPKDIAAGTVALDVTAMPNQEAIGPILDRLDLSSTILDRKSVKMTPSKGYQLFHEAARAYL